MRAVLTIIVTSLLLSGCLPLAIFANGSGSDYKGIRNNLGVFVAGKNVNTLCLSPALRLAIWEFEGYFGKKIVMSSGYRTPWHNYSVGGAAKSYHTSCMAADFYIPGVPKNKLIAFAKRSGSVGGLGCYPGRKFIHIDVRGRKWGSKSPVTFAGC